MYENKGNYLSKLFFKSERRNMKITDNPNYESMIDFMRTNIETNFGYSKIIKKAKEKLESEGKDFWEEFEKWKKERC
jgi:hypothetical protein